MEALVTLLPPELLEAFVTTVALATALRPLALFLQFLATKTDTKADDDAAARVLGVLSFIERALDWVSVGPTARKR